MAWQSGGSGGGAAPFSGAAGQNELVGMTLTNNNQSVVELPEVVYDTDGYLVTLSTLTIPKTGYYAVIVGFVSDSPFVGHWELFIASPGKLTINSSGASVAGQNPEGQLVNEDHYASGAVVTLVISQTSGADQLVYPYARIHYLGS